MSTHNFIVTGGCGFIGSHLVEALLLHDQNVLVVDDMSRGSHMCDHKRIKYLHQEVQKVIPSGTFDAIFQIAEAPIKENLSIVRSHENRSLGHMPF